MDIKRNQFFAQAKLMLETLPYVLEEECFALKGGTAINLFLRDMPRLSVDIDLTYLPIEEREPSLINMEAALLRISQTVKKHLSNIKVHEIKLQNSKLIGKLIVQQKDTQIKIEPNLVIRGTVFPCEEYALSAKAQNVFELFVSARTVSLPDVFGGKICAALDRQHPRDFYDIKFLLDNEGITEQIRKAFIVYLLSNDRPMHELLNPNMKDFKKIYETEFYGMADELVSYDDLVKTRARLVYILKQGLTKNEKDFLLSFKNTEPDWKLLGIAGIENLPALRWKQINIQRMDSAKKKLSLNKLRLAFSM